MKDINVKRNNIVVRKVAAVAGNVAFIVAMTLCIVLNVPTASAQASNGPSIGNSLLGTPTRLVLSCKDVITSLTWWSRLGFLPAPIPVGRPDSAITLTDGQLVITLTKESLPSPIIMYSCPRMKALKDTLDKLKINTTYDVEGPTYSEIRLVSPNGIHIAVRSAEGEPIIPVTGDSNRLCGKNTELSIGTGYLKREQKFWEDLGYKVKRAGSAPYNFALITDGVHTLGLHENRDIQILTITYFAENMGDRIKSIQAAGITLDDESLTPEGRMDSGMLTSPEGSRVFLFKGSQ
jgi:hypothetical protein